MKRKTRQSNRHSNKRNKYTANQSIMYILIAVSVISLGVFIFQILPDFRPPQENETMRIPVTESLDRFDKKMGIIENEIFDEYGIETRFNISSNLNNPQYTVFISITDTNDRANVLKGTAKTLELAWEKANKNTQNYLKNKSIDPVWIKVDVLDSINRISTLDLYSEVSRFRNEFFRKGVAFDSDMSHAFLEAEINGNKLIDYDKNELDLGTINNYLKYYNKKTINKIPDTMFVFTTKGWFCDENDEVYELYGYEGKGLDVGRRVIESFDRQVVQEVILSASNWLGEEINEDGSFIYGYYPTYDRQFQAYNLLRHTVSIQPLIWKYEMTGNQDMLAHIESTLNYLVNDHIVYSDDTTAFVIDRPNKEIKLGGNGLAIITMEQYMRTFDSDKYLQTCIDLGEGILSLMNIEEGTFYHVLNTDFSPKDEFRIVYYDGEATYALALLYEMTGDTKFLDAAKAAVENFIRKDYTKYRDHWVAYAMNEITKHYDEKRYFEFALRNANENLNAIYNRDTSYHTYLELLMASFNLYDRIKQDEINVDYLKEFDDKYFIETIYKRAEHMLNGFIYPEYAMYLKNPQKIVGSFFIRHDGYRIRIDDVEHFIAGYHSFYQNYEKLEYYREKFEIANE